MRTKGCRNLLPQEREKIAKELRDGATYSYLMGKYGLRSDSALRRICKDFNIDYINSPKKKSEETWEQTIDWLDDQGVFQITQGGNSIYLDVWQVAEMAKMMAEKIRELSDKLYSKEQEEEYVPEQE